MWKVRFTWSFWFINEFLKLKKRALAGLMHKITIFFQIYNEITYNYVNAICYN